VRQILVAALLVLAGCRKEEPATPTPAQSAQLNEAEDMLNGMATNDEGPEDRSSGPSNSTD
jgi:hypothetical protein